MPFTSESARQMLRKRGGWARARNERARGFPALAKARMVLAANREAARERKRLIESEQWTVVQCDRKCGCGGAQHRASELPPDVRKRILGW
jgi:hypothetical protein